MQLNPDLGDEDSQHVDSNASDAEIEALAFQLEEIHCYRETSKGKHAAGNPPDSDVAFAILEREVQAHMTFLGDVKLAHSVAHAIEVDSPIISDLMQQDVQTQQDRQLALQLDTEDQPHDANVHLADRIQSPSPAPSQQSSLIHDLLLESTSTMSEAVEEDEIAGPSMTYLERQQETLGRLSIKKTECCTCLDRFRPIDVVRLACGDTYCKNCLKEVFTRASTDLTRFPPRCHREAIPLRLVESNLSSEELDDFHLAEIEFITTDKTYCTNIECGKFIPPERIHAGKADCSRCSTLTCSLCKNTFHTDDCPADPDLAATLTLAEREGWRRCSSCRTMVEHNKGCWHMTLEMTVSFNIIH